MKRLTLGGGVLLAVLFSLGPFLWMVATSLKSPAQIALRPPDLLPAGDGAFYRAVFQEHSFFVYFRNSAIVASATTLIAVGCGALAAYPLARLKIPGHRAILLGVIAASMFPQIAIVGGVYRLLLAVNLLNSYAGLVFPYTALTLPLAIWVLTGFFRELPAELEEAARVDGCGPLATLFKVFIPVAAPAVFTTALLVFIYAWNEFFFALLINTDPSVQTLPVGIAKFPGEYEVPWGELAAAGVVTTLPLVLLVLVLQERIRSGLTAGVGKA